MGIEIEDGRFGGIGLSRREQIHGLEENSIAGRDLAGSEERCGRFVLSGTTMCLSGTTILLSTYAKHLLTSGFFSVSQPTGFDVVPHGGASGVAQLHAASAVQVRKTSTTSTNR